MRCLLLYGLLWSLPGCGQVWHAAPAATRVGAYGSAAPDAFYFAINQGALAAVKTVAASVYSERRFLLAELATHHLALAQPAFGGAAGLQLVFAGNADFNSSKMGLAYGRTLGKQVAIGAQFNYFNTHLRGVGNRAQAGLELAVRAQFTQALAAGLQVGYAQPLTGINKDATPGAYFTGALQYQPSESVAFTTEIFTNVAFPVSLQAGLQYHFVPRLWTKIGFNTATALVFVATGCQLQTVGVEVTGAVHPQLGFTPGLLLTYKGMGK